MCKNGNFEKHVAGKKRSSNEDIFTSSLNVFQDISHIVALEKIFLILPLT